MSKSAEILLKYWGYNSFRPAQEEIINSILEGKDTLALLPTGGGKSICFQVPVMATEGIGIVVTPLIALMKDQVENLRARGITASAIYSGMMQTEIEVALNNAVHKKLKFLYVSPERLQTDQFQMALQKMRVNILVVDEAHCISQWGYDFRPSYLKIAEIKSLLPEVPVMALTATATPEVVDDIQGKLNFSKPNVFQQSFERKNLTYVVLHEEDKLNRLLRVTRNIPGTGIVYMRNRRKTVEIAEFLRFNKVSADFYHAGLSSKERSSRQDAWKKGQIRVMVSTNAFGMGIDKPDVRFVVHLDLPDSIEAYFQEAGRGGRDGRQSYAVLMYHESDIPEIEKFLEIQYPLIENIRQVYHALGNYYQLAIGSGRDVNFEFSLPDFAASYNFQPIVVAAALKLLEKDGYLKLQDISDNDSLLFVRIGKEDLYKFQVQNARYDKFVKTLLRSYSGLFTEFTKINEDEIAKRLEIPVEEVVKTLKYLMKLEVLIYKQQTGNPQITFLTERLDGKDISISNENYKDRKANARKRLDAVLNYVSSSTRCRSSLLLEYFGEIQSHRCGKCDVCVERNKIEMSELEFNNVLNQVKPLILNEPLSIKEISEQIRGASENQVIKVIQWLLDNNKIEYDAARKLSWKK
ncbi:MAG: RecQ family ATP-dependent DNA helicase [Bacteroidales bacterium]|nr:RecQ family ATP-dependent DNA helicase [Bacteroidales bacterium]